MEYKSIEGPVFSRQAFSPPVINSAMANKLGVKAPCMTGAGQYGWIEPGENVKLRLVVDDGEKRITCHGKIDWVKLDEVTGKCYVGFGSLSLSDEEFRILGRNFVEETEMPVEFVRTVREQAADLESVVAADDTVEIMRHKAVKLPVSVIESIDIMRGDTPFSEFVVNAVRAYVKKMESNHIR